jgi:hypothetical protein
VHFKTCTESEKAGWELKNLKNRLIQVTLPYTVGFMIASISYTQGFSPFLCFVIGETVALLAGVLVRFLVRF